MSEDQPQDVGRLRELAFMKPPSLLRVPEEVIREATENCQRLLWASPDQIEDHIAEGYEFVERKGPLKTQPDGSAATDTRLKSREMVLMRIDEEKAREMEQAREYRTDLVSEAPTAKAQDQRDRAIYDLKKAGYSQREVTSILEMCEIKGSNKLD